MIQCMLMGHDLDMVFLYRQHTGSIPCIEHNAPHTESTMVSSLIHLTAVQFMRPKVTVTGALNPPSSKHIQSNNLGHFARCSRCDIIY